MLNFKILVVEDNDNLAKYIKRKIRELGYLTNESAVVNVKEAKHRLDTDIYHIALLDIDLANRDDGGIEVAKYILERYPSIPIIFLTEQTNQRVRKFANDLVDEAFSYLKKPIGKKVLHEAIQRKIEKHYPNFYQRKREENVHFTTDGCLLSFNKKKTKVLLSTLFWIESDENHKGRVVFIWKEEREIRKKSVVASLSNVLRILNRHEELVQTHQSYIVNIKKVSSYDSIEGVIEFQEKVGRAEVGIGYKNKFEQLFLHG